MTGACPSSTGRNIASLGGAAALLRWIVDHAADLCRCPSLTDAVATKGRRSSFH